LGLALLVRRVVRHQTKHFDQQWSARAGTGQRPADFVSSLARPRNTVVEALAIAVLPRLDLRDRTLVVTAPLLAGLVGHVLKSYVPRDRPGQERFSPEGEQSFPSTHAAHAAAIAFAVAHIGRAHGLGKWTIATAAAVTLAVAFARVRAGAHWPTDVLAGSLVGIASAQAAGIAANLVPRRAARDPGSPW
jgi:undecaprenyl-diphosphatase